MRVTALGYISRDQNILPDGQVKETVGGKGLYAAAALARSGVETELITWLPAEDASLLLALENYPVSLHVIPLGVGTLNRNEHQGDTTVAYTSLSAHSIVPDDLNDGMRFALSQSDVVLISPDIQEKIALATIQSLVDDLGLKVAADIGKYFRAVQPDGRLQARWPWPDQAAYLRYFDTVFLSAEDAAIPLGQSESVLSLARSLAEQGPHEVIITQGNQGAFVFTAETNEGFDIPSYPPKHIIDPTGAGDTFIGAYLAKRLASDNPFEAGKYAAMAASLKLHYSGPLRETAEEIEQRVKEREV